MTPQSTLTNEPFDVLVVDDQPMIIEAVRRLLSDDARVRVHGCQRATEALARATELRPALILQDISMPDGNGLDLVATYRQAPSLAECSVVVLSATEDAAVKAQAFALGANDYIEKLPPKAEFVARVHHHAQASRALLARAAAMRALEEKDRELQIRNAMLDEANDRLKQANQELVTDIGAQRKKVESLASAGTGLAQIQDLDLLLITILEEAVQFAVASAGAVFVRDGTELRATTIYAHGVSTAAGSRFARLPISHATVVGGVAASGHALRIERLDGTTNTHHIRLRSRSVEGVPVAPEGILPSEPTSMLMLPITQGSNILGVLALCDAIDDDGFSLDDERLLRHFSSLAAIAIERAQTARSLLFRLVAMAALRDPTETAGHVQRVAGISAILFDSWATAHALPADERARQLDQLLTAAVLHDVGKVAISDAILKKPAKLDDNERAAMQLHSEKGSRLLSEGLNSDLEQSAAIVAYCHHEKWDGTGYPRQLRGEKIPLAARIVAVADVYDALGSRRAYKEPWPREKIAALFRDEAGKHFDPQFAQMLLDRIDEVERVRDSFPDPVAKCV